MGKSDFVPQNFFFQVRSPNQKSWIRAWVRQLQTVWRFYIMNTLSIFLGNLNRLTNLLFLFDI